VGECTAFALLAVHKMAKIMRKKTTKPYVPRNTGPDYFIFKGFFAQIPRRDYARHKHDIASRLGITVRDLDRIICGLESPTEEQLLVIARRFALSFDDLFVFPVVHEPAVDYPKDQPIAPEPAIKPEAEVPKTKVKRRKNSLGKQSPPDNAAVD
jgi:transcriptional regulator with XRE-family HTH domain